MSHETRPTPAKLSAVFSWVCVAIWGWVVVQTQGPRLDDDLLVSVLWFPALSGLIIIVLTLWARVETGVAVGVLNIVIAAAFAWYLFNEVDGKTWARGMQMLKNASYFSAIASIALAVWLTARCNQS